MTDLCHFVDACRLPDDNLVDLIEQAFLEGQIDGVKVELAYCWLVAEKTKAGKNVSILALQRQ